MYYFDKRLQYPVKCPNPDPQFARMLQQAIGGVEGEIRVCMQYFFQAWGNRAPTTKYRDMLLNTATEEIGHIEMLATAVALNLDKAPTALQEEGRQGQGRGRGDGRREPAPYHRGDAAPPHSVDRHGGLSGRQRRRAVRHEPHLRQRQHRGRHVRQRRRREHGAGAGRAAVQRGALRGHERHAALYDRAATPCTSSNGWR